LKPLKPSKFFGSRAWVPAAFSFPKTTDFKKDALGVCKRVLVKSGNLDHFGSAGDNLLTLPTQEIVFSAWFFQGYLNGN
jgi:hypothetical protein